MQIKFLPFFLMLTIFFHCTLALGDKISDRLIVAVGNNSFSQQELENYFFAKSCAVDKKPVTSLETNWRSHLGDFTTDMILLGEAERVGGFQMDKNQLELMTNQCQKLIPSAVNAGLSVGKINEATIRTNIQMALKVENYRTSRQWAKNATEAPSWFKKLYDASKVRSFDGADKYLKLQ